MCATCGCSPHATAAPHTHPHADHPAVEAAHAHSHADPHHDHAHASRLIRLEHEVLARNDALAAANRRRLAERGVVAVNVLASPGAGKTTLLEQTIRALRAEMPLVVIEAMLASVPVVASAVGSVPDAVVEGETGLLVPPDDPIALANAIDVLRRDGDLRRRMGDRARELARLRFMPETAARAFESLYSELLNR